MCYNKWFLGKPYCCCASINEFFPNILIFLFAIYRFLVVCLFADIPLISHMQCTLIIDNLKFTKHVSTCITGLSSQAHPPHDSGISKMNFQNLFKNLTKASMIAYATQENHIIVPKYTQKNSMWWHSVTDSLLNFMCPLYLNAYHYCYNAGDIFCSRWAPLQFCKA